MTDTRWDAIRHPLERSLAGTQFVGETGKVIYGNALAVLGELKTETEQRISEPTESAVAQAGEPDFAEGIGDEEGRIQIAYGKFEVRIRLGRTPDAPSVILPCSIARDLFDSVAEELKARHPNG